MENVFFKPWIGNNYKGNGFFQRQILALGDTHRCGGCQMCGKDYADECEDMQTSKVVNDYLDNHKGKWSSTYRKFERALVGHETDNEESKGIWHSIAFYNYIQTDVPEAQTNPSFEDYRAAEKPFFEVLEFLRPDVIIAWGKTRLYRNMPYTNWEAGPDIEVEDETIPTGFYKLEDGSTVRIVWIRHPCTAFTPDKWHRVMKRIHVFD